MRSVLLIKTSAIGDVLHAFVALEYLRCRFPEAVIDWVVEQSSYELLAAHPLLTRAIPLDTRSWRSRPFSRDTLREASAFVQSLRSTSYDLLFDLQGNTKSALITALARAKTKVGFDRAMVAEWPNLLTSAKRYPVSRKENIRLQLLALVQAHLGDDAPFTPTPIELKLRTAEQERLQTLLKHPHLQQRSRLMVAFGSKWPNKQLSLESLSSLLHSFPQDSFLFPFGSRDERAMAESLASLFPERSLVVGDLSLPLWQHLMSHMDLVIAMDSAALHLCGTTATPSISFFGPSSGTFYRPLGEQHRFFQAPCPYGRTFERRCPQLRSCKTGACLKSLAKEDLAQFSHPFE